jgi:AraC family transcriptional regulator
MDFRIEKKDSFQIMGLSGYEIENSERVGEVTGVWAKFMPEYDRKLHDYYTMPYAQVGASDKKYVDGKMKLTVGAEYKGKMVEGMDIETVPAATYAVFSFDYPAGYSFYEAGYNKILTEWLPTSGYIRDDNGMDLEVYHTHWEIWIPVLAV